MIPEPPENKAVKPLFLGRLSVPQPITPNPRDEAPHAGRPGRRRRVRPPVRDVNDFGLLDELAEDVAKMRARIEARKGTKPE